MKYGINLLMWTDTLSEEMFPLLDQLREIGYDAVELPIFETDLTLMSAWGDKLHSIGMESTASTVIFGAQNLISPDASIRRAGIDYLKQVLDCCAAAGSRTLIGPYHSALGEFSGKGPTQDEWSWCVESMREIAEHAETVDVKLGLEYLNRFECYFLNTAADGARFVADVGHPYCGMMYDTFHSHIEEKSTPDAIRAVKDCLVHVHISENDRSTPGQGNVRWDETFDTLKEVGYDGFMVCEAFGLALEKLVAATKIWRRMYDSEVQLATDALAFMKGEVAKRW